MFKPRKKREKIKLSKDAWKKSLRIFSYLKPYKITFGIGLIFLILSSLASMVFPALAGQLVDAGTGEAGSDSLLNLDNINHVAAALFAIFALNALFSFFRIYTFSDVTERMLAKLRQDTYSHLIKLPMSFFAQRRVGELNSRISADIALLQEAFTTVIAELIRQVIIIVVGMILLFYYSWKLTLIMMATLPVMIVIAVIFGKFIKKLSKRTQDRISESNVIVEETLTGIANVKAYVNEFFEMARYTKSTDEVRLVAMKGAVWRGAFAGFIIFALFGSIVLVIWQGVLLKEAGEIQVGELFSFILYSVFVGASFGGTADLFARVQKAVGATENLFNILDEKTEELNITAKAKELSGFKGAVAFKGVNFNYASRAEQVLKNINFTASPGETVALVGQSGAGKSTIASLLLQFYKPVDGQILFDGKPAKNYDLRDLRHQMGVVPQEVILFGGTIRENIAYGNPEASQEQIIEAAQQANAMEFIGRFEDGFDTVVGERGVQLSGGQRQRIAIARAILKNPKILILDEATSSLDSESEEYIQDALEKLMKGRTSVVIAHRLSTIKNADKILVLKNGEIVESGTHEELLNLEEGSYKKLTALQLS